MVAVVLVAIVVVLVPAVVVASIVLVLAVFVYSCAAPPQSGIEGCGEVTPGEGGRAMADSRITTCLSVCLSGTRQSYQACTKMPVPYRTPLNTRYWHCYCLGGREEEEEWLWW